MKKIFLLLMISVVAYSKCEFQVKKLIENATRIAETHSYSEPEYKGNNIYETTIFDEDSSILDVLSIDSSTGTVYTIYDFYNKNNNKKRLKLYQDIKYKCTESL
jgi:hypothetical protein